VQKPLWEACTANPSPSPSPSPNPNLNPNPNLWEACTARGKTYYPPTYAVDGFTHATADPAKLLDVANHFYKSVQAEWLCL
jgi:hypothetical protein